MFLVALVCHRQYEYGVGVEKKGRLTGMPLRRVFCFGGARGDFQMAK